MANPAWLAGQSGNPTGIQGERPKGLAVRIREKTNGLELQIQFLIDLSTGVIRASNRDRLQAVQMLLDRGYGKALEIQAIGQLSDEQRATAQELTREQLLALVSLPAHPQLFSERGAVDATFTATSGPATGPASTQVPVTTGKVD